MPTTASRPPCLHRPIRWMTGGDKPEPAGVRRAMLLTLREPVHLTIMTFVWVQMTAWIGWSVAGQSWMLWWAGADVVLMLLRLAAGRRIHRAEVREERLPVTAMFLVHGVWLGTLAAGSFLTVSQPDVRMVLLGALLPAGGCGYVVSRWQAFPRFATLHVYGLWVALFAGLRASALPGLPDMAWPIPAGGMAFHVLLALNHSILATALRAQQENRRLSMHDPLTDLPNRLMLRERLTGLCRRLADGGPAPAPGAGFAVMCLDLDGFKDVNDRHGHAAGDWLLKSVSRRLVASARPHDVICRVGGDEFVALLPAAGEAEATGLAGRLLAAIARPHDLGGLSSTPGRLSIGIALAPDHGNDPEALLAAADAALYAAKRAGKGTWRLHPA